MEKVIFSSRKNKIKKALKIRLKALQNLKCSSLNVKRYSLNLLHSYKINVEYMLSKEQVYPVNGNIPLNCMQHKWTK